MASPFAIRHATHLVRSGGVIIYPTDTVYGLGCDPMNQNAVSYLGRLKQRDPRKGLILVANKLEYFNNYIEVLSNSDQETIQQATTPTSWIVAAKQGTPEWLTGNTGTLAIRITRHPVITELCNRLHHPLVSTSANPSTKKPAVNALQVHRYFHNKIHAILIDTNELGRQPSTIRVLDKGTILRP